METTQEAVDKSFMALYNQLSDTNVLLLDLRDKIKYMRAEQGAMQTAIKDLEIEIRKLR